MDKFINILKTVGAIAPLFTAIAALVAVGYGVINVNKQIDRVSEIKAIELFNDYSNRVDRDTLFLDMNNFLDTNNILDTSRIPIRYRLFANYCLFIAESIFNLVGTKESWIFSIKYIIRPHIPFYRINASVDESLSAEFREFYKKFIKELNQ